MKKTIVPLLIFTFICTANFAQTFNENFDDGSFTDGPVWSGDADEFIINAAGELQLNDDETATAYLSTPVSTVGTTTWEFLFRLDFAPSTTNQLKVYLNASAADLSGSLSGYFVQIGASGTDDAIEFRRQNGSTSSTLLISSTAGSVGGEPALARVRVVRDAGGNWQLFADYTGGTDFTLEGTVSDDTYPSGNFFGIHCKYSSTRADKFFLDDIVINLTPIGPPEIQSITPISNTALDIRFSEPVTLPSAENVANYTVSGIGSPANAQLDAADASLVHLTGFSPPFSNNQTYTITAIGVEDLTGDASNDSEMFNFFIPIQIEPFDILINEFLAANDENFTNFQAAEYVELYNRSDKVIDLSSLRYSDGNATISSLSGTMEPESFVVLTNENDFPFFDPNLQLIDVTISLTNGGDVILLTDSNGQIIDQKVYNSSEVEKPLSTELVNPDGFCMFNNWQITQSPLGGTPGLPNSVLNPSPDQTAPSLICVNVESETSISLLFDEILDKNAAEDAFNYDVDNNIGSPANATLDPTGGVVILDFNTEFEQDVIYTISINNVSDCTGGNVMSGTGQFSKSTAEVGDLIINELVYQQYAGGKDFLEIYNNSDKILSINEFQIFKIDDEGKEDDDGDIEAKCPIMPGEYLAFSEDPQITIADYPLTLNPDRILPLALPAFAAGDIVYLLSDTIILGRDTLDKFAFDRSYHNPLLDNIEGVSLERICFDVPTQDPNNWQSAAESADWGTPGYENSQHRPTCTDGGGAADCVTIEDEVFSPDGDGFEDFLQINYNLDTGGYIANVRIFDARGRQVKELINNQFLEPQGFFRWDGDTDEGRKARLGIYIVWVELFDVNGNVTRCKNTCVVAGQL